MWKGLSIFAGIILLAIAGLNFMEILPQMQNELNNKRYASNNVKDAVRHLDDAETSLEEHQTLLTSKKSSRNKMELALAEATEATKDAKAKLEVASKKLVETKDAKANLDKKLEELGGFKIIVAELKSLATKQKENALIIKQKQDVVSARMEEKKGTEDRIDYYKKETKKQENGLMDDAFSGSIAGVDPQFGFISINKGNGSKVVKGARLDVRRGSETIATLLVTRVLPSSSVCDIVTGSLAAGQSVQVGDRVVVSVSSSVKANEEKEKAAQPKDTKTPAAAPGSAPAADPLATPAPATSPPATADPFAAPAPASPAPESPTPAPATGTPVESPVAPATPPTNP